MLGRYGICLGLILSLGCAKLSAPPVLEDQPPALRSPAAHASVPEIPTIPPSEEAFIAFWAPVGPCAQLFLYDDHKKEVFVLPGAGKGIDRAIVTLPDQYLFVREGQIFLYNALEETVCIPVPTRPIVRFALEPTPDALGNLYFLGTDDPQKASLGIGRLFVCNALPSLLSLPNPFPQGAIEDLRKVNSLCDGDITSFKVTLDGSKLVFATVEGSLFLYTPLAPSLLKLPIGILKAALVTIDPIWGRFVVWKELGGKRIFELDLVTECIQPLSLASEAVDIVDIAILGFLGADPWHVFYVGVLPAPTRFRVFSYDLRDGAVRDYSLIGDIFQGSPSP